MMHHEFEELAGYEVSYDDYVNIIEPMYIAVNMTKQEFVKVIDKKRFALKTKAEIIRAIKKEAKHLAETCEHFTDYDSKDRIESLLLELERRFGGVWFTIPEYMYPEIKRGCTYPARLVNQVKHHSINHYYTVEDITLVK